VGGRDRPGRPAAGRGGRDLSALQLEVVGGPERRGERGRGRDRGRKGIGRAAPGAGRDEFRRRDVSPFNVVGEKTRADVEKFRWDRRAPSPVRQAVVTADHARLRPL